MKGKGLAAAVMIACLLTGCVRYDGSRIGNESTAVDGVPCL